MSTTPAREIPSTVNRLPLPFVRLTSYYVDSLPRLRRLGVPALRLALGVVYVWFGVLKVAGLSPVGQLVRDTVSFIGSPAWIVPAIGLAEVAIGAWLLIGRGLRLLLPIFVAHMAGTFAVLVTQPGASFRHGNPLELTSVGEFVIKNLVLLTAGIVVMTAVAPRRAARGPLPPG